MIKSIGAAQRHPVNRSLEDFRRYWGENHGPLFSNVRPLTRRYVQHITLLEAYGIDPAPTFDGVSMFWSDDLATRRPFVNDPLAIEANLVIPRDDQQLFDRIPSWPTHHKRASVTAEERVVLEGTTTPEMVKAVLIVAKLPGLTLNEFFDHWQFIHGPLTASLPGLRRYVQNHAVPEAYLSGSLTHDGWSELWFDDLAALHSAAKSPEWQAMQDDGAELFAPDMGVVVARERIQKDIDFALRDWGVGALDEDAIRQRLRDDHYTALADDPDAPAKIKRAAANGMLGIWTDLHLVTIDESRIDARPDR